MSINVEILKAFLEFFGKNFGKYFTREKFLKTRTVKHRNFIWFFQLKNIFPTEIISRNKLNYRGPKFLQYQTFT